MRAARDKACSRARAPPSALPLPRTANRASCRRCAQVAALNHVCELLSQQLEKTGSLYAALPPPHTPPAVRAESPSRLARGGLGLDPQDAAATKVQAINRGRAARKAASGQGGGQAGATTTAPSLA